MKNLSRGIYISLDFECMASLVRTVSWEQVPNLVGCRVPGPFWTQVRLFFFLGAKHRPLMNTPHWILTRCRKEILSSHLPILVSQNTCLQSFTHPTPFLRVFLLLFAIEKHRGNYNNCKPGVIAKFLKTHIFFQIIFNEKRRPEDP